MEKHEFYMKYANLPINERFETFDKESHGTLTFSSLYHDIKTLDEEIATATKSQKVLLKIAEAYFAPEKKTKK